MTLAEALRGPLGLTGTKIACNRGACSACTVWLDGPPICACMMLAIDVGTRSVTTIEGLATGRNAASGAASLHRTRCAAMRLLHAGHGHELRGAARAQRRSRMPTMSVPRSAGTIAAAAPIRTSSPRRSPPPKRTRGMSMAKRANLRTEIFPLGHRQRRPRHGGAPDPRRRAAAAAAEQRTRGHRQVSSRGPTAAPKSPARPASPSTFRSRACCTPACCGRRCRMPLCDRSMSPQRPVIPAYARSCTSLSPDDPRSATLRYVGAPVAAVAAVSMAAAEEALHLIRVDYEPLPFVADMDDGARSCRARWFTTCAQRRRAILRVSRRQRTCRSMAMCAGRQSPNAAT